jgi:hypothetical protein
LGQMMADETVDAEDEDSFHEKGHSKRLK